ncbi:hypothetical protein [Egbenema bharatensis]|uniref:hypothetical protein n=1 Tax=Egbenema bharatensis TaxID=3463334 RepID=UPI003A843DFB
MTGENCIFNSGSESDSLPHQELPNRESIKLIAIGSPEGVNEIIHHLHVLNFRDATTWSRFLPTPNPNEVMKINTHYRRRSS